MKTNGTPIDLRPKMLFDSPFLSSEHDSGVVHAITKIFRVFPIIEFWLRPLVHRPKRGQYSVSP